MNFKELFFREPTSTRDRICFALMVLWVCVPLALLAIAGDRYPLPWKLFIGWYALALLLGYAFTSAAGLFTSRLLDRLNTICLVVLEAFFVLNILVL